MTKLIIPTINQLTSLILYFLPVTSNGWEVSVTAMGSSETSLAYDLTCFSSAAHRSPRNKISSLPPRPGHARHVLRDKAQHQQLLGLPCS